MNRRSLLKRLGAAIVVAPIALVVASEPAKAESAVPKLPSPGIMDMMVERYYGSPEGRAELMREACKYMGEPDDAVRNMRYTWEDGYAEGHEEGLRTGLKARVDSYYSVERLAYVTQASHGDQRAIRLYE